MQFIKEMITTTLEIKKSKFIAYIFPYKDFKLMMERLKSEHPKARHFVYAYRYLNEFGQVVENSSDDGEPKGTSGKPALNVLSGNNFINGAVIIVRYFGGVKLGTGGLVKAYSDAVNLVLEKSILIPYVKLVNKTLKTSYSKLSQLEYIILSSQIKIIGKEFDFDVILLLEGSEEEFDIVSGKLFQDMKLKNCD